MAWEWLAPAGTAFGAAVGALAVVASGRLSSRAGVRAQEVQLEALRHQTESEDRRARVAAKQTIYGRFLAELDAVHLVAIDYRLFVEKERNPQAAVSTKEVYEAMKTLLLLQAEVVVLGGPQMYLETTRAMNAVLEVVEGRLEDYSEAKTELVMALHKDIAGQ
ncbi:hypothetical protein [Micromonospora sp. NPDC003816]|uniref:hypothetical protein n=1 Tax=Micromonospora sp. NPDC003816 TaxID=3364224 RepID=UPI0036CBE3D6